MGKLNLARYAGQNLESSIRPQGRRLGGIFLQCSKMTMVCEGLSGDADPGSRFAENASKWRINSSLSLLFWCDRRLPEGVDGKTLS